MACSGLATALSIGVFIALTGPMSATHSRADSCHSVSNFFGLKLDRVRDRRGTDRQRANRDAGHVAAHRHAAVERELLDHLRQQAARQRRRIELGPEIDRVNGRFSGIPRRRRHHGRAAVLQPLRDLLGHLFAEGLAEQRESARGLAGMKCLCRVLGGSLPVLVLRVAGRPCDGLDQILDLRRRSARRGPESRRGTAPRHGARLRRASSARTGSSMPAAARRN